MSLPGTLPEAYDDIGNMTLKTSENLITPQQARPGRLNYSLAYHYDGEGPHQATRIGELFYSYDPNGNVESIYRPAPGEGPPSERPEPEDLGEHHGSAPEAFGRYSWDEEVGPQVYVEYHWNEENRMILSESDDIQVRYTYDHAGLRTAKQSSQFGETLYPDRLYQEHFSTTPPTVATKHIFLGQTRIVSKVHHREQNPSNRAEYMRQNSFTYHADHLGSTNWVSDFEGNGYEHFQYTPYGESWVAEQLTSQINEMSHRFTGQELDQETGLYAFPARYYDPQTSRWLGADPAMDGYLPVAPISEEARQHNRSLPGLGGVFNYANLAVYHYGGNNPLKYHDPTGMILENVSSSPTQQSGGTTTLGNGSASISAVGCVLTAFVRIANAISGDDISLVDANSRAREMGLFEGDTGNLLSPASGAALISALTGKDVLVASISGTQEEMIDGLQSRDASSQSYYAVGRILTTNADGSLEYGHQVNINDSADEIRIGPYLTVDGPQAINDTSDANRRRLGTRESAGRSNQLLRVDFFFVAPEEITR